MAYKFLNSLTVINSTFSSYNSGGTANDSLKVSSSNLGASFGVQNTNASGYAGIEYIDNSGNVKVFTGFNNGNGQEFRFNNVASGGYIDFLIGGTTGLKLFNNRNVTIGSSTDAGYKLDVNGTGRVQTSITIGGAADGTLFFPNTTSGHQMRIYTQYASNAMVIFANGYNLNLSGGGGMTSNFATTITGSNGNPALTVQQGNAAWTPVLVVNAIGSTGTRFNTNGNVLIGTTTDAGYKLDIVGTTRFQGNSLVSLNQNAETSLIVSNTTSGTTASSVIKAISSNGGAQLGKYSATSTTYKSIVANDGYIYNYSSGNISILNDYGSGNINFTSRGSSAAQVILNGDTQPLALIGAGSSNFSMNANADVYFYFNSQSVVGRIFANPQGSVQNTYDQPVSVGFVGTFAGGDVWYGTMNGSGGTVKYNCSRNGTSHSHIWYYNFAEQMRLAYTGNLLIGTSTDAGYKLDVNGTARVQGVITGSVNSGSLILGASAANSLAITITGYFTGNGAISTANSNARGFNTNTGGQSFGYSSSYTFNNQVASTTDSYFRANGAINITAGTIALHGYNFSPTITSETGATIYAFSSTLNSASNHYNLYLSGTAQNYIAGNVGIGTSNLSSEANIYLGAKSTIEGGQLVLQKGTSQTYATHLDNYNDQFRVMVGTDTGSTAAQLIVMHATGNVLINSGTDNGYKLQVAGDVNVNTGSTTNNLVVNADTSMFYNLTSGGGQVKSNVYTTSVTTRYYVPPLSTEYLFEWDPTLCQGIFVDYVLMIQGPNFIRSGTLVIANDNGGNVTITDNINSSVNGSSTAFVTFSTAGLASIKLGCNNLLAANDVYVNIVTRYIPNIY